MKKTVRAAAMLLFSFLSLTAGAQNSGNHYQFRGSAYDDFRAATKTFNGHYYVVGNTQSASPNNRILLCKMDKNGSKIWSRIIFVPGAGVNAYYASDIQAGYSEPVASDLTSKPKAPNPDYPGNGVDDIAQQDTYSYMYISGTVIKSNGQKAMLLLKIDSNASVAWAKTDFNATDPNIHEEGVSVESTPDGGAFLVGHSNYRDKNVSCVSVARFNSTGVLQWFNRYTNVVPSEAQGNFIPRQSCLYEEIAETSPTGIAVTGSYFPGGANRSQAFIMRIDHGGIENWRSNFPSGVVENNEPFEDAGWDITLDLDSRTVNTHPIPTIIKAFIVAGRINSRFSPVSYTYLFKSSVFGDFIKGHKIFSVTPTIRTAGLSITNSGPVNVVVLGKYDEILFNTLPPGGYDSVNLQNYLMNFDPVTGTVNWTKTYMETEPLGNEHLAVSDQDYVIASTQVNTTRDAIVYQVNASGFVNTDCPADEIFLVADTVGASNNLEFESVADTAYAGVNMVAVNVNAATDSCLPSDEPYFNCSWCITHPIYRVCCCSTGGQKQYRVCFKFDTTACMVRNWSIKMFFDDSTAPVTTTNGLICHTYDTSGTHQVSFEMSGEFYVPSNHVWTRCTSAIEYMSFQIDTNCMSVLPDCSSSCEPVSPKYNNTDVGAVEQPGELEIYPNPAPESGKVTIKFSPSADGNGIIELLTIEGKKLSEQNIPLNAAMVTMPLNGLSAGTYFIRYNSNKSVIVRKLVVSE